MFLKVSTYRSIAQIVATKY